MKTFRHLILFVLLTPLIILNSFAKGEVWSHLGVVRPQGEFAGTDFLEDLGAATIGGGVGFQYQHPIGKTGLNYLVGFNTFYHIIQKNVRQEIKEYYEVAGYYSDHIKYPMYVSFPLYTGIRYVHKFDEYFALSANFAFTYNHLKITRLQAELTRDERQIIHYDWANNAGYKYGFGVIFNSRAALCINFFRLGIHTIDGEVEEFRDTYDMHNIKLDVNAYMISLSYLIE